MNNKLNRCVFLLHVCAPKNGQLHPKDEYSWFVYYFPPPPSTHLAIYLKSPLFVFNFDWVPSRAHLPKWASLLSTLQSSRRRRPTSWLQFVLIFQPERCEESLTKQSLTGIFFISCRSVFSLTGGHAVESVGYFSAEIWGKYHRFRTFKCK